MDGHNEKMERQLEAALATAENPETRFHLRQGLQLLRIEEPRASRLTP